MTSSLAIAGAFDPTALEAADQTGTTLRAALIAAGGDPARIAEAACPRAEALGYLEVHIEQGPVLEAAGEALGVVSAIAGQGRYRVRVSGQGGHAGTVPMNLRRDALAAAAEMVLAVESIAKQKSVVATVGQIAASPGAVNVIPEGAEFSLDLRAEDDAVRRDAFAAIRAAFDTAARRRGVAVQVETVHDKPITATAPRLKGAMSAAIARVVGRRPREMMSGAGHDGQAMAQLTDTGMIFVRCRGGISHSPREYASPADIGVAIEALIETVLRLGSG
jgi:allantoate deiminase